MDKTKKGDRQTGRVRAERKETGRRERQEGKFPLQRRGTCGSKRRTDYAGGACV